jgi:hypothetical protein
MKQDPPITSEDGLDEDITKPAYPVVEQEMPASLHWWTLHVETTHVLITVNMFTQNSKPRKRGRPSGRTAEGEATRHLLYDTAVTLIGERGYEATKLRDVAGRADVSVGLLYRYFPSKRSIVLALYDELSDRYAQQATEMPPGTWRARFIYALETSIHVLGPHRVTL